MRSEAGSDEDAPGVARVAAILAAPPVTRERSAEDDWAMLDLTYPWVGG